MTITALQGGIAALVFGCVYSIRQYIDQRKRNPAGLPYPPGPKGYPIIGNLFDIPALFLYKHFKDIGRQIGSDIIHVQVFGLHLIVLNSKTVADDLLEKRSSIYSDRPRMPMLCDLMGFGYSLGFTPYGQFWKDSRKLFHRHFQPSAVIQFRPKQLKSARRFLQHILESPEHLTDHLNLMAGSVILDIGYGIQVENANDYYIRLSEDALKIVDRAGTPGAWLVDIIPSLQHVPEWFPGAGFKRQARIWRDFLLEVCNRPFDHVKREIAEGTAAPSFCALSLSEVSEKDDVAYQEQIIRNVAATLYTAGADTSVSVLRTFFLAMLLFPEIQVRAQEEIDRVVGHDRLPTYDDEPNLPYIGAMLKEVLRWQQVAPFGIPHRVVTDDVYNGYFIPKDSIILGNAWAICHDERMYRDPSAFRPERFLAPELDPRAVAAVDHAFGFGRRMCPGRWMAYGFIWITMANTLAAFTIEKPLDAHGRPIEPSGAYSGGILGTPEPFECAIKPRSRAAEALVKASS